MAAGIPLARQVGRVQSSVVPLDAGEEVRYRTIAEEAVTIDVHQHPFVLPEVMEQLVDLVRIGRYQWGYDAVRAGGWDRGDHRQCVRQA